nr:RING-H2 finger protein ATL7-like isoform X1 [Ipomoea batatas]
MSYNAATGYSGDHEFHSAANYDASCCSSPKPSAELKVYQAFIFSVPIFFAFLILFLFYYFYLRRQSADWSSLRMRASSLQTGVDGVSRCELGLKKEIREMLPIIVYKESFSVKDTQCAVCLGDYQAEDRLQQIPICGHTFHMDCIDHWLATRTTCPLCRHSVLTTSQPSRETTHNRAETIPRSSNAEDDTSLQANRTLPEPGTSVERVTSVHSQEEQRVGTQTTSEVMNDRSETMEDK